jgi:RNA polymerase subunit RPABC4/transcription elongation factor Spt4
MFQWLKSNFTVILTTLLSCKNCGMVKRDNDSNFCPVCKSLQQWHQLTFGRFGVEIIERKGASE